MMRLAQYLYWETDAEHRFTRFEHGPRYAPARSAAGLIGKARWELPSTRPDAAAWAQHKAALDARLPFHNFEFARIGDDGKEHVFLVSGEPVFDAKGHFTGYRGIGSEITELRGAEVAQRASEARFRSLVDLSADWYWEQNEQFRFTHLTGLTRAELGIDPAAYVGRTRWEEPALNLTEADWEQHRALLRRREQFFDFEIERPAPGGRTVWVSVSGEPIFDERGDFRGYRGVGRNITERKRAEQIVALEHAVVRCIADAETTAEALEAVLRTVCESERWECGRYLRADEASALLHLERSWGIPDPVIREFIAKMSDTVYRRGVGLSGNVWDTGQPVWIADIRSNGRASRASIGEQAGIRGAFVFPVKSDGRIVGVLAFSSREVRAPDRRLMQAVGVIGTQVGQFLKRKQAEEALRSSEERFRSLTQLSSDFFWETDSEHNITSLVHGPAYAQPQSGPVIGKKPWGIPARSPGAEGWAALRKAFEEHRPFRDFEYSRPESDGRIRYLAASGEPSFDASGAFRGYFGSGRDITERKRNERMRELEHDIVRLFAEAAGESEALRSVMRAVCEVQQWEAGRFFRADAAAGVLRFAGGWCEPGSLERFLEASRGITFAPGVGLAGIVWESGKPLWVPDVTRDARVAQGALATAEGIRGSLVVPVFADGETIGVLAFSGREIRGPDQRLLEAIAAIGSQAGQFLKRCEAEGALREREERFRSLVELSSDYFWETDEQHRFTLIVSGTDIGLQPSAMIGRQPWEMSAVQPGASEWATHRATLEARLPFRDFETVRVTEDGRHRHFSSSGEPRFAEDGRFLGYRGVGRDVTRARRNEQLLRLEHRVAHSLAEAESESAALQGIMRAVCESEGWSCGRYLRVDEAVRLLRFAEFYGVPGDPSHALVPKMRELTYAPGVGLVGCSWQGGEPLWVADIHEDPRTVKAIFSLESGSNGLFVFPVKSEGKVIGIFAFNSREIRQPDERLMRAVGVIGGQIGQFLQRKRAEQEVRESEERFRRLVQMSSDFFWETDAQHRFTELVFGASYTSSQLPGSQIGKARWELPSTRPDAEGWARHKATVDAHLPFREFEFSRIGLDGAERHYSASGEPRLDAEGNFLGYRGVGRDLTEIVRAREQIARLAYSDALTGLANRTSLAPALEHAVNRALRFQGKLAVVFFDLDGFKEVNDAHGHEFGDRLLVEVAARMRTCLRSADLIARPGGDEFIVVLEDIQDTTQVETVVVKLLAEIAVPYAIVPGEQTCISASAGISMLPEDAADPGSLMRYADAAMYMAKRCGKNRHRFYANGDCSAQPVEPTAPPPRAARGRDRDTTAR